MISFQFSSFMRFANVHNITWLTDIFFRHCLESHYASSDYQIALEAPNKHKGKMQNPNSYRKVRWPLNILRQHRVNMMLNHHKKRLPDALFLLIFSYIPPLFTRLHSLGLSHPIRHTSESILCVSTECTEAEIADSCSNSVTLICFF